MAEGGLPDTHNLTEFQENIQAQHEEIAVLQSIFDGDEERLRVLDSAESSDDNQDNNSSHQDIKMYIPVKVPENMHVEVYLPLETSEETEVVNVNKDHVNGKQAFGLERSESGM
ncbi:uncharacterized protein LOC132748264 [Ruditapes philippinarum]|uniref:uncharacterized protein LOC132748264 n=1 Tax=Ruditapes philippinarum TaxID=129788 RepID=UPI00295BA8DD|nr:uncharacterized protein LOC132748264 [Ruditapes philippinarum]